LKFVRERAVERYDNTVILTTHIAREVEQLCRRIAMLNRGNVVYQGTVDDLRTSLERGQIYRLRLEHLSPEAFEALAARVGRDCCRRIETDGQTATVELAFANASAQLGDILRQLLFSGVNVVECSKREQSFEEMFRAVFEQRAGGGRAAAAGAAAAGA
jgi:ABC-2 type transport system ATP-binding protein